MTGPFRLRVLGGMQLLAPADAADDELARAALLENRRRVLAVLTVLAVSERPLTRDQLADFFWGDSEPARARHSVAEALRLLRRVLGEEAIAARAADLTLAPGAPLEVDAVQCLAAHARGDHAEVVTLYRADFLDGVYVERAPRFDGWVDRQRDTLQRAFLASCAAECRRLIEHGEHAAAVAVARRWLDAAPLSAEAAAAWMRAQLAPGTAEAVHVARQRFMQHASQLASEYDVRPAPELEQLLDDAERDLARRATEEARGRPVRHPVARPHPALEPEAPAAFDGPVSAASIDSGTVTAPTPRPRRRMPGAALLVLLMALPLVVALWRSGAVPGVGGLGGGASASQRTLVVADADIATADTLLGHAITLAMTTALAQSTVVQPLPPSRVRELRRLTTDATDSLSRHGPFTETLARTVAARAGAAVVAVPVVVSMGARYRVSLRVVNATDGSTLTVAQSDVVDSGALLDAVDEVVRRSDRALGASRAALAAARPLPDLTTASLPALRLFAQGARAFARQDFLTAARQYQAALAIDSTFALAWMGLGRARVMLNLPQAADTALAAAQRYAARLSERERLLVRVAVLRANGLADSAIQVRGAWLAAHPDDREMLEAQLYDLLTRGRPGEAVAVGERLVAVDSANENVLANLALAYPGEDPATRQRAVALYARALQLDPSQVRNVMTPQLYGGLLVRAQLYDSAARLFQSIGASDQRLHGRAMRALGQMELLRGRPGAAVAPFEAAVRASRAQSDTLSWVRSRLWLASALYMVGDSTRGRVHVDSLAREAVRLHEPPVQYWIGVFLARLGRVNEARAVLGALERSMVPTSRTHAADRALLAAEIAVASGQTRRVALPALADAARGDSSTISDETLAWVTLQAGDTSSASGLGRAIVARRHGFGFEGWLAAARARAWLDRIGAATRP